MAEAFKIIGRGGVISHKGVFTAATLGAWTAITDIDSLGTWRTVITASLKTSHQYYLSQRSLDLTLRLGRDDIGFSVESLQLLSDDRVGVTVLGQPGEGRFLIQEG